VASLAEHSKMANAFQHSAFQVNAFQEGLVDGVLYAIDQNDTGSFTGTVTAPSNVLRGDGDAWKKRREIDKKIAELELAKRKAMRDAAAKRKQDITDLVDPKPKTSKRKQKELQSNQELKAKESLLDLAEIERAIAQFERQKQDIATALAYKQEAERLEAAIAEANRLAELDDEEALLALL
jgi:hypothetical protein